MCSQTPNNAAVTALNSADTPQQPNPDLLLQLLVDAQQRFVLQGLWSRIAREIRINLSKATATRSPKPA